MRIISKFRDYYDIGLSYGLDPKLVYVRDTEERVVELGKARKDNPLLFEVFDKMIYLDQYMIYKGAVYFCGKVYPFYTLSYHEKKLIFYSYESLIKFLNKNKNVRDAFYYYGNAIDVLKRVKHKSYFANRAQVSIEEFDTNIVGSSVSDDLFIKEDCPIIIVVASRSGYIITRNPRLREYGFASKVDPYVAFQELSMYLGSNLAKQVDPSEKFSDNLKRDIAGFDNNSFRKQKKGKR